MRSPTVLFICNKLPRDFARDVQGGYLRMRMFIDAISRMGSQIHFIFFVLAREILDAESVKRNIKTFWGIDAVVTLCPMATSQRSGAVSFWNYYIAPAITLRRDLEFEALCGPDQLQILSAGLATQPSAVFIFGLEAMLPLTLLRRTLPPTYFDLDNIEHRRAVRTLGIMRKSRGTLLRYLKVPAIVRAERAAINLANKTFVCSDSDKAYLERKFGVSTIRTIPNAVDFAVQPYSGTKAKAVLFLGSLSYPPNNAAVELLVTAIWPIVSHRVPDASLLIVGPGDETVACRRKVPPSVQFTGFVPDVKPYYEQARVVCCPIMAGAGTRIKLIEAAAYAKAIVSTTIGAEGLDFRDGVHALIRDTPELMADACVELLLDADRARSLGEAARAFAEGKYSRQSVISQISRELSA